MDVVFTRSEDAEVVCEQPLIDETIRYGDPVVLRSCASRDPVFLAMVRHLRGKRSPSALHTEIAAPGVRPDSDYIWTFVPAAGSKKKRGDRVEFAERVRIQLFDYMGNYRFLAINPADSHSVMAEKTPSAHDISTWSIACAARLRLEPGGRVLPDGERKQFLEYGTCTYLALINAADYLCARRETNGTTGIATGMAPDLPAAGMGVWWRVYRRQADVHVSV